MMWNDHLYEAQPYKKGQVKEKEEGEKKKKGIEGHRSRPYGHGHPDYFHNPPNMPGTMTGRALLLKHDIEP